MRQPIAWPTDVRATILERLVQAFANTRAHRAILCCACVHRLNSIHLIKFTIPYRAYGKHNNVLFRA